MNFKKFMSGVSALAIAASAFAAMAVTANAGEVSTVLARGGDYTAWSAEDVALWTGSGSVSIVDGGLQLANKTNAAQNMSMPITVADKAIVTFDMVYNVGASYGTNNYANFKLGDSISIETSSQGQSGALVVGGVSYPVQYACVKNHNRDGDTWTIHMEIDTALNKITTVSILGSKVGTQYPTRFANLNQTNISMPASYTMDSLTLQTIRASSASSLGLNTIQSINITQETQEVTTAAYTINYNFGGNTIKTVSNSSSVGSTVYAESPITIDNQKYYAADGSATSVVIGETAANNVLNVTLREAEVYTVGLVNSLNGGSMGSTSVTEGEDADAIYYDKFILDGTTLYSTPALMDSARTYAYKFTNVTANATQTLNFTAREGEYVFYQEAEDIAGWNHVDDLPRMSGGAGGYPSEESTVTTLPAGKYKVYVGTRGATATSYVVKAGATELINVNMQGYIQETASSEFEAADGTAVTVSVTGGSSTRGIDYILIEKTGDVAQVGAVTALGTYTTGSGDAAKAFTFTVTPNDDTITSITVTDAADSTKTLTKNFGDGGLSGSGEITFGILVTASDAASLNKTFTVTLN